MGIAEDYADRVRAPGDMEHITRLHAVALRYRRILELGVRSGMSTAAFLAAAQASGGHVCSIDIEPPRVPASWQDSGLWTFTLGDDMTVPLPPGPFGLLFIDTSHSFEHTAAELDRFAPLVEPGGRILLHDTACFPGVRAALESWCPPRGLRWDEWGGEFGMGEIAVPGASLGA